MQSGGDPSLRIAILSPVVNRCDCFMAGANHPGELANGRFHLAINQAHVWLVDLALYEPAFAAGCLSAEEQSRAARFHFKADGARFMISRALLRRLLGRYLSRNPADINFSYGPFGKPALAPSGADLRFNLAHTKKWAAYVFSIGVDVGIDVEDLNRKVDWEGIATRFFAEKEFAWIRARPPADRPAAFFRCWTRKEAILKGLGTGLGFPLTGVDVASSPGQAIWMGVAKPGVVSTEWVITDCDCAPDCYGAVAVGQAGLSLQVEALHASFF